MTDAAADARDEDHGRLAWRIGGGLLIACAAVSLMAPFLQTPSTTAAVYWVQTILFSAALIVFAIGIRGAGSVVARHPLGVIALVLLGAWPFVQGLFEAIVPFTMDVVELYMAWGYVGIVMQLGAAIVAVTVIARAGVIPSSWRWAPLWALVAAIMPQLILQAVAASPGSDVQAMAGPVAGLSQLMAVAVPLSLGILALLLAGRRPVVEPVQVYPPAD
jgi:hypothetical protein